MAFLKYKELTQYFNFFRELEEKDIPSYIRDYITSGEKVLGIYKTFRDHGVFTNKKIVLFDQKGTGNVKEITIIPYKSFSTCSIKFKLTNADILVYLDSGYPLRLRFVKLDSVGKKKLRILYNNICEELI